MIQRLNPYGWYIQWSMFAIMVGGIIGGMGVLVQHERRMHTNMRVLSSYEAAAQGWPREWGE